MLLIRNTYSVNKTEHAPYLSAKQTAWKTKMLPICRLYIINRCKQDGFIAYEMHMPIARRADHNRKAACLHPNNVNISSKQPLKPPILSQ